MPLPPETQFIQQFLTTTQQQEHLTLLIQNGASEEEQLTFVRNIREQIATDRRENQGNNFPLKDNLISLIFLVQADLNEGQRERVISAMNLRDISIMDYSYEAVKRLFMELFCSTGTSVADPMSRRSQRRNFLAPVFQDASSVSRPSTFGKEKVRARAKADQACSDPQGQLHVWTGQEGQERRRDNACANEAVASEAAQQQPTQAPSEPIYVDFRSMALLR